MKRRGFFRLLAGGAALVAAPALALKRKVSKWLNPEMELVSGLSQQVGMDIDAEIVEWARQGAKSEPLEATVVHGDGSFKTTGTFLLVTPTEYDAETDTFRKGRMMVVGRAPEEEA